QAEDGIRDRNVTGVQTCALPIFFCEVFDKLLEFIQSTTPITIPINESEFPFWANKPNGVCFKLPWEVRILVADFILQLPLGSNEIGRASCRERVWIAGLDVARTK